MKKKIVSILMAIMTIASVSMTGCNEKPETSVGASGKNLTDEISKIKEEETTTSATEEITESVIEVPTTESVDISEEKIETVKNAYLPRCARMCKEADNICTNTEWKYYESEDYVEFLGSRHSDTEGTQDYRIWFSIKGDNQVEITDLYINGKGVNSETYMYDLTMDILFNGITEEPTPTEPPVTSSNMWNIYVTGNTDLAVMAGNTLIDKAGYLDSRTYGDVLSNGRTDSDGVYHSYSNVSVAVNESPTKPMTGTIVVNATRTDSSTGMNYPLTVTVKWEATDFGDHVKFTWLSKDING